MSNVPAIKSTSPAPIQVGLTDSQSFELAQRVGKLFATSSLVPKEYQGNLPNCVIALNMASRMGADPMMVMQNLVIIYGRPSWSSQFLIATFNKSGRFSAIRYEFEGTPGQDDYGCTAVATELATGEVLRGTTITIALAKAEEWYQKKGSKWQTMPQQMLMYRAASWFIRAYAPEIAMGLHTAEELHDTYDLERQGSTYVMPPKGEAQDLNSIISVVAEESEVVPPPEPEPVYVAEPVPADEPDEKPKAKRLTQEELDGMRADAVAAIEKAGVDLAEVEKTVNEYSTRWNTKQIERVMNKILPRLAPELAEA
ncbi:MAG: hypothetical protein RBR42_04915 [Desulfomicrobium sp.]|jgi:hypothetical protein|nr:hypothetical protein [Desulfomicrobium sp.]